MAERSDTRIDIRTDPYRKRIITRAAELVGTNVTRFILDRVYPEAERIVARAVEATEVIGARGVF